MSADAGASPDSGAVTFDAAIADAAADGSNQGDAAPIDCKALGMIDVATGDKGNGCIEKTEVTQAAYAKFVEAVRGRWANLPATCAAKTSHTPGTDSECQEENPFVPALTPDRPVSCVDWCDAWAYCDWAGKKLCGRIRATELAASEIDDKDHDEWYRACSHHGDRALPYGNSYDASKCQTGSSSRLHVVGSVTSCEGGYPGVFDMSGNVAEWVWSCDAASAGAACATRGGDYGDGDATSLGCKFSAGMIPIATRVHQIGFRCCK